MRVPQTYLLEEQPSYPWLESCWHLLNKQLKGSCSWGCLWSKETPHTLSFRIKTQKMLRNPRDLGAMTVKPWAKWAKMHTMPYLSCPHLNHTSLIDLFHIRNEQCGSEVAPEKILSVLLAFHTNTENLTKWLCCEVYDCIVQLLRLIILSLQKASKLTYLRVSCVDILLLEILAGSSRYFPSSLTCNISQMEPNLDLWNFKT